MCISVTEKPKAELLPKFHKFLIAIKSFKSYNDRGSFLPGGKRGAVVEFEVWRQRLKKEFLILSLCLKRMCRHICLRH